MNSQESLASLELRREATSCGSLWGLDLTWILRLCSDLGQIRDPSLAGIMHRVAANAVLASPSRSNRLLLQLVPRSRANTMACFGDRCSFPSRWLMSKGWVLRTALSEVNSICTSCSLIAYLRLKRLCLPLMVLAAYCGRVAGLRSLFVPPTFDWSLLFIFSGGLSGLHFHSLPC
ncbi:hypothetical protein F2Q69_00015208 [Brassica cretica]|uniref:Uncharacterized protein n=1 Tax=Brassica cretica TaxID=69181 RepID=A0A8S9R7I6_BRACR|nr:hypothetical protein F2Q69_00015208 [Brassica cretica]